MKKRIAIVGGGISGLTAAYILQRDHAGSCEFTLFEATSRFGGIVETVHRDGFTIECGPDSWVTEKPWAEQLARELELADDLLPSNDAVRRTYIAKQGSLIPLPDAMRMMVPADLNAILTSSLFSETAKQAYRSEPSRADELRAMSLLSRGGDESVAVFVRRHFGDEVVETVAGPLLAGVFGGDIHKLSARALLAPFVAMEAEHGSLITGLAARESASHKPVFTTLASGLGTLVDRLLQQLPPSSLAPATTVLQLQRQDAAWVVKTSVGSRQFDGVLLATSLDTTRQLLAALSIPALQEAATLLPREASSSLIVALGYEPQRLAPASLPSGFGLLVAPDAGSSNSLLACTFLNQKFAHRAPEGAVLLRAFFGSAATDQFASHSDQQIIAAAREQLSALLGVLPETADIALVRRWPRSLPQYEAGHVDRIAQFDACLSAVHGLRVLGNALRGVGLPDLIRDAGEAVRAIASDLEKNRDLLR